MLIWETPSLNPEYVTQYNARNRYTQKQWGNKSISAILRYKRTAIIIM